MSDGFFGRVLNLIRGASESFLKDLERDNPEAVYQAAIEAENLRFQEIQQSIASLTLRRDRLNQDRERTRREIADLGDRAAREAGRDDDRALKLLEQKAVAEEKLTNLDQSLTTVEEQLEQSKATLPTVKERLAELKAEKDQMLAKLRAAEARDAEGNLSTGYATNAADRALQTVREQAERLASVAGSRTSTATPEASTPATRAEAARSRAQAELEALKKLNGEPPAAQVPKVEASPRPARTLEPPAPTGAKEDDAPDEAEDEPSSPDAAKPGIPRRTL